MYNPSIAQLLFEHIRMRRVLRVMERQLDLAERCERPDLVLLRRTVDFQRGLPSRLHHSHEDRMFERLAVVDPHLSPELRMLCEQHRELQQLEDELMGTVMEAAKGGQTAYPRLLYYGRSYLRVQKSHSKLEEKTVFPRAAKLLTKQDWELLDCPRLDDDGSSADAEMHGRVLTLYRLLMDEAKAA